MDQLFILTILLIFVAALAGSYLKRHRRDRALKEFDGFYVMLELWSGQKVWGRLKVFPNGLEIVYSPGQDAGQVEKTSFILFQSQLGDIRAICRYHEELTPRNQQRRRREIEKTFHPNLGRRMLRKLRNFVDTFRDAINESFGVLLSRMKGASQSALLQTQDQRLQRIGQETVGILGSAYDPILERYVGRWVVARHGKPDQAKVEHRGILKEYSPAWFILLDCRMDDATPIRLRDLERLRLQRNVDFQITVPPGTDGGSLVLRLENHGDQVIRVQRVQGEGFTHAVDRSLEPGAWLDIALDDIPAPLYGRVESQEQRLALISPERAAADVPVDARMAGLLPELELVMSAKREADLCLPQTAALVRHGGEYIREYFS